MYLEGRSYGQTLCPLNLNIAKEAHRASQLSS